MIRLRKSIVAQTLLALLTFAPAFAFADIIPTIVPAHCTGTNCSCADLTLLAQNLINASIFIAVFLSAILFAWAGWKFLSGKSVGSTESISSAKEILWNVVVGLAIIISAWLVVDTIVGTLTKNGAVQGAWNSVCPK